MCSPFCDNTSFEGDESCYISPPASESSQVSFYKSKNFRVGFKGDHRNSAQNSSCKKFLPYFRTSCLLICSAVCIFQAVVWSLDKDFVAYETGEMRMAVIWLSSIFSALCVIVAAWEAAGGSVACTISSVCLIMSSSVVFGLGWEDHHSRASILWSFLGVSILIASSDSLAAHSPHIMVRLGFVAFLFLVITTQLVRHPCLFQLVYAVNSASVEP